MNDTPRNNKLTIKMNGSNDAQHLIALDILSNQLERELAAMTEQRDRLAFKLLMATVGEPNSSADHCWVSEEDNF